MNIEITLKNELLSKAVPVAKHEKIKNEVARLEYAGSGIRYLNKIGRAHV
jgi:hypothetical protein